jgi:hypothetical protein
MLNYNFTKYLIAFLKITYFKITIFESYFLKWQIQMSRKIHAFNRVMLALLSFSCFCDADSRHQIFQVA